LWNGQEKVNVVQISEGGIDVELFESCRTKAKRFFLVGKKASPKKAEDQWQGEKR